MLSAQTTDKRVNQVTAILFQKYPTLHDLKEANLKDIEQIIKPIGTYTKKAKNVKNAVAIETISAANAIFSCTIIPLNSVCLDRLLYFFNNCLFVTIKFHYFKSFTLSIFFF